MVQTALQEDRREAAFVHRFVGSAIRVEEFPPSLALPLRERGLYKI
jgi:hypothetical protein